MIDRESLPSLATAATRFAVIGAGDPGGTAARLHQSGISRRRDAQARAQARRCEVGVPACVRQPARDQVKVYPTENYYYFYFYHDGIKYAGNFRFDIEDRDKGLVHFNYFKDFTLWQRDETDYSAVYGAKDGIEVKKAGALAYEVGFEGKKVLFELNDLSQGQAARGRDPAERNLYRADVR